MLVWQLVAYLGLLLSIVALSGCTTFARKETTGVIIARRAQVRSSTAVVAADLTEILRGDVVDILESTTMENNERWLRVRLRDTENTEGWIEERNVMPQEVLDRSRQLAEEDKDVPVQATGQLRANTNLRYSPERNNSENILLKLDSGTNFDIVGWKRVSKTKSTENPESDDTSKDGAGQPESAKGRRDRGNDKETNEATELWYKVRLRPSESPAPAGWVFGKQVELTVPSDIIFYRTGREFVAWQRLDETDAAKQLAPKGKDAAVETQPGSWVILEKSSAEDSNKLNAPDFDRIFVLGYDKSRQEHYTAYRSPDVSGQLPMRVAIDGNNKMFSIRVESDGRSNNIRFKVTRDPRGLIKVEAQDEIPKVNDR